jgi:hypothetical protein
VSSEGIFNLHNSVEAMEEKFSAKIGALENFINQINLKDENFLKVIHENEILRRQNALLDQKCRNLEFRMLSLEK